MEGMRRALIFAFCLGPTVVAAAPPQEPGSTAEQLQQAIEQKGAETILYKVYEQDSRWQHVLAGVATGSPAWLQVAERLKRVAREQSEELTVAVARALEMQPGNVLAILGQAFDADDVCSLNTLEQSLGPDYAVALRSVEKRERAVARVTDPALREPRDECLAFLRELRREVIRNRKTWFSG
jgi:hypothetical protein